MPVACNYERLTLTVHRFKIDERPDSKPARNPVLDIGRSWAALLKGEPAVHTGLVAPATKAPSDEVPETWWGWRSTNNMRWHDVEDDASLHDVWCEEKDSRVAMADDSLWVDWGVDDLPQFPDSAPMEDEGALGKRKPDPTEPAGESMPEAKAQRIEVQLEESSPTGAFDNGTDARVMLEAMRQENAELKQKLAQLMEQLTS
eukprot:6484211-Amphidinium_carterae.3